MADKIVFRWTEDLRGGINASRAMASMPNHYANRMIEEHELTADQSKMTLDELVKLFPKPRQVRSLQ